MDNERIIRRLTPLLKGFDALDLSNSLIVVGLNAVATLALIDEFDNTSFDYDISFGTDYDHYFKVTWWQTMTGTGDSIVYRFRPLHVEDENTNLVAAYDRAMKII